MCRAYAKKFYDMLGDAVYDEDVAGLEETVVHTLQEKGLTIATAESCTGGLIAQVGRNRRKTCSGIWAICRSMKRVKPILPL